MTKKNQPQVKATCYSDDRNVEIDFDAASFFANELNETQTLKNSIECLDACNFSGDYATDAIAEFYSESQTKELFDYLSTVNKKETKCGFFCSVEKGDVVAWLKAYKPEYVELIN